MYRLMSGEPLTHSNPEYARAGYCEAKFLNFASVTGLDGSIVFIQQLAMLLD